MSTVRTSPVVSIATSGDAPDAVFTCVQRVATVRVRQEREDGYLLYQPATDELHLVDARGKAVFDLCDGRSIDAVIADGARLLCADDETEEAQARAEQDVFAFLHQLQARSLVAWI
jgi:hypothetical protein